MEDDRKNMLPAPVSTHRHRLLPALTATLRCLLPGPVLTEDSGTHKKQTQGRKESRQPGFQEKPDPNHSLSVYKAGASLRGG